MTKVLNFSNCLLVAAKNGLENDGIEVRIDLQKYHLHVCQLKNSLDILIKSLDDKRASEASNWLETLSDSSRRLTPHSRAILSSHPPSHDKASARITI
jgi:hypothetical protein